MAVTEPSHFPATVGDTQTTHGMNMADSSDFEYEYDENETEDFYFTLDVQLASKLDPSAFTGRKIKGRSATETPDRLQVLDLPTNNPLIKFGDTFYSCHWSTDLGTQFYVAKPGLLEEPLRRGYVVDVLGISRARLTGTPVTLHRRLPQISNKSTGSAAANAIVLDDDDGESSNSSISPSDNGEVQGRPTNKNINRLTTARQKARDPHVKAQASFLERLAIIKHKNGEKDTVPVFGVEGLTGPSRRTGVTTTLSATNPKRKSAPNLNRDYPGESGEGNKRHSPAAQNGSSIAARQMSANPQPARTNEGYQKGEPYAAKEGHNGEAADPPTVDQPGASNMT